MQLALKKVVCNAMLLVDDTRAPGVPNTKRPPKYSKQTQLLDKLPWVPYSEWGILDLRVEPLDFVGSDMHKFDNVFRMLDARETDLITAPTSHFFDLECNSNSLASRVLGR